MNNEIKSMKLCVDCKHIDKHGVHLICNKTVDVNMSDGSKVLYIDKTFGDPHEEHLCTVQRRDSTFKDIFKRRCGKHGKWWEPRENNGI